MRLKRILLGGLVHATCLSGQRVLSGPAYGLVTVILRLPGTPVPLDACMKNVEVPSVENVTFGCKVDPLLFDVSVTRPLASTVETPLLVTTVHVPLSMVRVG